MAASFAALPLDRVARAPFVNRTDRKFLMTSATAAAVLERCRGDYRVVAVEGEPVQAYRTCYFDTADLALYRSHHANRRPRHKVREREYVVTGDRFLEVKVSTNAGRTIKVRVPLCSGRRGVWSLWRLHDPPFSGLGLPVAPDALRETLDAAYARATFVRESDGGEERATVDIGLTVSALGSTISFDDLAIIEVKTQRAGPSRVVEALRGMGVRESSVSKYCLGIAALRRDIKHNAFKEVLARCERLTSITLSSA